jgi:GTP-binding protein HflX
VLLADTVGFIRKLPHALVESFKATFEEIRGADLLIHVIDASHPARADQIRTAEQVLEELELGEKPRVDVYNKVDLMGHGYEEGNGRIGVSALKKKGLEALLSRLDRMLVRGFRKVWLEVPHVEGALVSFLHRYARILNKSYSEKGTHLQVEVYEKYLSQLKPFRVKANVI